MIRNIIFDVGKVLVSFEPDVYMDSLGFNKEEKAAVNRAMFQSTLWVQADEGLMEPEAFLEGYVANAPEYEAQIRRAYRTLGGTVELFPYTMGWLQNLKDRGYRLYILSNYGKYLFEQTRTKMKFLSLVDGVLFSNTCQLIKPDPEIYLYLLRKYGLEAAECVFLDDRVENVEAAVQCGIYGIQFIDYESGRQALERIISDR